MIMFNILFLTAHFLSIDLHLSICIDLILMNNQPFYEDVVNEIYASPSDTKRKTIYLLQN